jgi:polyphosphate kinase
MVGEEEVYLGSADWMPRNLYERVEVIFPVKDERLRDRIKHEILDAYLVDNVKARILQKNGDYVHVWKAKGKRKPTGQGAFNAQEYLIGVAEGRQSLDGIPSLPTPHKSKRALVGRER